MMSGQEHNGPVVWLLSDDKPGHKNQLRGLAERLESLADAQVVWIDVHQHPVSWLKALLGSAPAINAPWPNIIVAAGSSTHRLLLACRKRYGAMTVVLMRPGFPRRWVDLAIIPAHDNPPEHPRVLETRGVLNAARPQETPVHDRRGLILIGGPSRHYIWNNDDIFRQILTLCEEYPDWTWSLTTSRRTPSSLVQRFEDLSLDNITFYHHEQTAAAWLPSALAGSRVAWVSPDSVSMVYESLTASLPVGLFRLTPRRRSRIVNGLRDLQAKGLVVSWDNRKALMQSDPGAAPRLWEAERAAHWIIEKYKERH